MNCVFSGPVHANGGCIFSNPSVIATIDNVGGGITDAIFFDKAPRRSKQNREDVLALLLIISALEDDS